MTVALQLSDCRPRPGIPSQKSGMHHSSFCIFKFNADFRFDRDVVQCLPVYKSKLHCIRMAAHMPRILQVTNIIPVGKRTRQHLGRRRQPETGRATGGAAAPAGTVTAGAPAFVTMRAPRRQRGRQASYSATLSWQWASLLSQQPLAVRRSVTAPTREVVQEPTDLLAVEQQPPPGHFVLARALLPWV